MRRPLVLAMLIALFAGVAFWGVSRLIPAGPARSASRATPVAAEPVPPPTPPAELVMAPLPTDPATLDQQAVQAEARSRYAALRDAFARGKGSPSSGARLEPALKTVLAGATWDLGCRGLVCRVIPRPATRGWQAALTDHQEVKSLAERVATDPDSADSPAFVLLQPTGAEPVAPGGPIGFFKALEAMVLASPEVAECLKEAEPGQALELHLELDGTGLTYRMAAGLGPKVSLCASMALTPIMSLPPPPGSGSGTYDFKVPRG